ncbi:MAG TPA: SRPBCC family protein [Solirubrobacteraceae bacterium]|nr:SRPBCC family protein [Solirubrobacteraceae bacterium]
MTVLSGSSSAEIPAPIARCWTVVEAIDEAPDWQTGLERVEVLERDDQGRAFVCDTVNDVRFTKVHCRVRLAYDPPHRLTFTRVASEDVDAMDGSWELEELGSGRTRATYNLAVDPGPVPVLARPLVKALRPLVVGNRAGELARAVAARG